MILLQQSKEPYSIISSRMRFISWECILFFHNVGIVVVCTKISVVTTWTHDSICTILLLHAEHAKNHRRKGHRPRNEWYQKISFCGEPPSSHGRWHAVIFEGKLILDLIWMISYFGFPGHRNWGGAERHGAIRCCINIVALVSLICPITLSHETVRAYGKVLVESSIKYHLYRVDATGWILALHIVPAFLGDRSIDWCTCI